MRPSGEQHYNWKGGRTRIAGYHQVKTPGHPDADCEGYVMTHRLVAERVIGHVLPTRAVVHHRDGNKGNNTPSNLVICEDDAYHLLLHQRIRAMKACGDVHAHRCWLCGVWENSVLKLGNECAHRLCRQQYDRQRYLKRRSE